MRWPPLPGSNTQPFFSSQRLNSPLVITEVDTCVALLSTSVYRVDARNPVSWCRTRFNSGCPLTIVTMIPKVRKAVFPAAGLGTRFLPATKAQPKEMLPLVDKPLIQYAVEEAIHSGVQNI